MYIHVNSVLYDSLVDGEGVRNVVFCTGCIWGCEGCHSKGSWNKYNGKEVHVNEIYRTLIKNPLGDVTFSGGDPMLQAEGFTCLAKMLKDENNKNIWCYTGFLFENILKGNDPWKLELLKHIDVLVDGRFELDKRDVTLQFKGSSNQRIIDVQKSLKEGAVVLYEV